MRQKHEIEHVIGRGRWPSLMRLDVQRGKRREHQTACETLSELMAAMGHDAGREAHMLAGKLGVVLDATIGADGVPSNVEMTPMTNRGFLNTFGFEESAIQTLQRWRFFPVLRDGKPVALPIRVRISFH
jgi:hypothetical protein